MSDKPKTRDSISVLFASNSANEGATIEHKELIEKIQELYGQNSHKAYDTYYVSMVKDPKMGVALVFEGEREESNDETAIREAKEGSAKKRVEEAELKEYLRLNKKYGKKQE